MIKSDRAATPNVTDCILAGTRLGRCVACMRTTGRTTVKGTEDIWRDHLKSSRLARFGILSPTSGPRGHHVEATTMHENVPGA